MEIKLKLLASVILIGVWLTLVIMHPIILELSGWFTCGMIIGFALGVYNSRKLMNKLNPFTTYK